MAAKVLRLEPIPSASDPSLVLRLVMAVSAGQRDAEALAEALQVSAPAAQACLDAGVWLGLLTPGAEVMLTRRGMALAAASPRRRRRLLAAAMWLTPEAAALLRHIGSHLTVERVSAALRAEYPTLSPDRLSRLAASAVGLLEPAVEFPHAVRAPDVTQLRLPFSGAPTPPRGEREGPGPASPPATAHDGAADEHDDGADAAREALLEAGELSLSAVAGLVRGPAGLVVNLLIVAGHAERIEGGIVATPALAGERLPSLSGADGPFLERIDVAGLGVAWPRALAALSGGLPAVNLALRRAREGAGDPPSAVEPRVRVHGGLLSPGERPPRMIPDGLSLRLRALTCCPALALLGALLLLDRRVAGRLRIDAETGALRWRRKAVGGALETFSRFARDQGWIPLVPSSVEARLSDAALVEAAVGIGLARRTEGRLLLDEALFARLADDIEAGLTLEALSPLVSRLEAWLEHRHRGADEAGVALFIYGSLLTGEPHARMVGEVARAPARARGRLWVLPQGFPVMVLDAAAPEVAGERVVGVPLARLVELDDLEGTTRGLYRRVFLVVETERGPAPAMAYVMSEAEARRQGCRALDLQDWRKRAGRPGVT